MEQCLWYCHHDTRHSRVHLMNVEQRQAAADNQTKPTNLSGVLRRAEG